MNFMKKLIALCLLAILAGSSFIGCAHHEKKMECCAGGKTAACKH